MTTMTILERNTYFQNSRKDVYPQIFDVIAEIGAENVFYISNHYSSHYYDDDCTFTYWNNKEGKIISDCWTTRCYCPDFKLYTANVITFEKAIKEGLVNMDLLYKYAIERAQSTIKYKASAIKGIDPQHHPLVKVSGGRKWKGTGFLVSVETSTYGYGYGQSTTKTARILSTEDFQIHHANYQYVEFMDFDNIVKEFADQANKVLEGYVKSGRVNEFFEEPNNTPNISIRDISFLNFDKFLEGRYPNVDSFIANAYDPEEEERKRKFSEQKSNDFARLMEWVENKTDKTSDIEKTKLAIHVMKKPNRY